MKILEAIPVIDNGSFSSSPEWKALDQQIRASLLAVHWPYGSKTLTLYNRRKRNSLHSVRRASLTYLRETHDWAIEAPCSLSAEGLFVYFDAISQVGERKFCMEWKAQRISSGHMSMNKLLLGMINRVLIGGAIVLPDWVMRDYVSERAGTYEQLALYFQFWKSLGREIPNGLLIAYQVTHDDQRSSVPRLTHGLDARLLLH